jgi:LCP family protein required for cell wall assembly
MAKKILIIILAFIGIYVAYFALRTADFYKSIYKNGQNTPPVVKEKTEYNILLLGYGGIGEDGKAHEGPYLTDSLMIAHVDIKKNTVSLTSLPRDLWVKLPTKSKADFHSKINSLYQISLNPTNYPDVDMKKPGSPELLEGAIKTVTGLTIDNYIAVDFTGFEKAINSLGGVDVDVQKTFDDYEYPLTGKEQELCGKEAEFEQVKKFMEPGFSEDEKKKLFAEKPELETFFKNISEDPKEAFPCRYEHLHFDKGMVHMDGATALKYVRSRHSLQDGSDFGRAARQQQFVKAVKNKLISVGMVTKVFSLMNEVKSHVETDIPVDEMKKFMGEAGDAAKYRFISIHMSDTDYLKSSYSDYGGYILIPRTGEDNWKEIQTMINNGILEVTPTPSPLPTSKVTPTPAKKK